MTTIAPAQAWNRIIAVRGQIIRVVFRTKTAQRRMLSNGLRTTEIVAGPGRIRTMVCRRLVQKFTLGVISREQRMAEDVEHNILTVWDIQTFNLLRRHLEDQGVAPFTAMMQAGRRSYRRINMADVLEITGA